MMNDPFFELTIIAFGTHLSEKFGYTVNEIVNDGFKNILRLDTMPDGDSPEQISRSMGKTIIEFSDMWNSNKFDLVFALGDRFEMFAAVSATIPFNIKVAHIHGGETTIGAIDNAFRHCITHMSHLHFASTEIYKNRIIELVGNDNDIYNTGALSYDNLIDLKLLDIESFKNKYAVDLSKKTILITLHPETVAFEKNEAYVSEFVSALKAIEGYQFLITMPNADTNGNIIREKLNDFVAGNKHAFAFENLGTIGYLSAMKHCTMMLGNTSSGCIEASFFSKYVINIGNRQKGRIVTQNIRNCSFLKSELIRAVKDYDAFNLSEKITVYGEGNSADKIIQILKIHG